MQSRKHVRPCQVSPWSSLGLAASVTLLVAVRWPVNADDAPRPADTKPLDVADVIAADKDAVLLACRAVDEETGKPVAGATVHITYLILADDDREDPGDDGRLWQKRMDTTTDAEGRYTVPVPEWAQPRTGLNIRVVMEHRDYLGYWNNAPIGEILKKEGQPVSQFRTAKLTQSREIVGRVLKPDGTPVAKATLFKQYNKEQYAFGPDAREVRDNDFPQTDEDGRFRCKVAARGYVAIRFRAGPDLIEQPYVMSANRDQGDIRLSHGTRFIGRVLTSTDEPLENAYVAVQIEGVNGAPCTNLDADGRFKTEAFGAGKHTVRVGWNGPDGNKARSGVKDPPEIYLPVEVDITGEEELHELTFRPIPRVVCVVRIASAPAKTKADANDLRSPMPYVEVTGEYQGRKWAANAPWFNHDLVDDTRDFVTIAPKGLTNAELSFHGFPQRVQLRKGAPLLFGDALRIQKLDADLLDLRIHRYRPTTVNFIVKSPAPAPDGFTIEAQYAREPAMRAAGMVFRTSEAAMMHVKSDDGSEYSILPDEEVQFTIKAPGYVPTVEKLKLREEESKTIEVNLRKTTSDR